jgi:hypothetical protein
MLVDVVLESRARVQDAKDRLKAVGIARHFVDRAVRILAAVKEIVSYRLD